MKGTSKGCGELGKYQFRHFSVLRSRYIGSAGSPSPGYGLIGVVNVEARHDAQMSHGTPNIASWIRLNRNEY